MARYTSNNARPIQGGYAVPHMQDFIAHVDGSGWRHQASQIDVQPLDLVDGTTVQEVLQEITELVTSSGTGFISIGNVDGYAVGKYNVGTLEYPTLASAFEGAFADDRLTDGGVILVLAGKYTLTSTVIIPPGITIMGEVGGTLISGEMIEQSMFIASSSVKGTNINGDSGGGDIAALPGSNIEKIKLFNLMLVDNMDGYAASGGPSMITVPFISANKSSNLELENVSFFGRLADGAEFGRLKTLAAVTTNSTGPSTGTCLNIKNCYIDGVKIGINFNSSLGILDTLNIDNTKCRFFGSENGGSNLDNSFIISTVCNANISNNIVEPAGNDTPSFISVNPSGGITSLCKMIFIGNSGGNRTSSGSFISKNESIEYLQTINTGNSWCKQYGNWYVTVGGATLNGNYGDINGEGAIERILSLAAAGVFSGTVVVNPGTYNIEGTIASSNFANIKFIGNKKGRDYPIFNLNVASTSTDIIGNRYITLGNYTKSIKFQSTNTQHSIRFAFNPTSKTAQSISHNIEIDDCIFNNTSCTLLNIGTGSIQDANGIDAKLTLEIKNCEFRQTGLFANSISLISPRLHNILINNCNFTGNGYALNLGDELFILNSNIQNPQYMISNCKFNLVGFTISNVLSGIESNYIRIEDTRSNVNIDNTLIFVSDTFAVATPIDGTLLSNGSFSKFCNIICKTININNTTINSPSQIFSESGQEHPVAGVFLSPQFSSNITNSIFTGGLPLQFSGINLLILNSNGCINISNNQFILTSQGYGTFLAIDKASEPTTTAIKIINNTFKQNYTSTTTSYRPVLQYNLTVSYFATAGIQVYCKGSNITFTGNSLIDYLNNRSNLLTINDVFGILLDNIRNDTGMTTYKNSCIVSNNDINIRNFFAPALSTDYCGALYVRSNNLIISENNINVDNTAALLGAGPICCLITRSDSVGSRGGIISNNYFGREDSDGTLTPLRGGYVHILNSAIPCRGIVSNNVFSRYYYDDVTDLNLIVDDNTGNSGKWLSVNNINERKSLAVRSPAGTTGITRTNTSYTVTGPAVAGATTSRVAITADSSSLTGPIFHYNDTGNEIKFNWSIQLSEIIPPGAILKNISAIFTVDVIPSTTRTAYMAVISNGTSVSDTSSTIGTGGIQLNIDEAALETLSQDPYVNPDFGGVLYLRATINHSSSVICNITDLTVVYQM